ncbi:protein white-like isoform X1 [Glandiceps talaboti]
MMELGKLDVVSILSKTRQFVESPDRSSYFDHSDCVRYFEDSGTGTSEDLGNNHGPDSELIESETAFANGDCFRFRSPSPSTVYRDRTVSLAWNNVSVTLRTQKMTFLGCCPRRPIRRKQLLGGVNGFAKPGNLLAVIGKRGSGKSTLLHTLAFHRSSRYDVEGNIMANSEPADSSLTGLMALIPPDDLFLPALTVREHLQVHASLRIRGVTRDSDKMKKVDDILDEIELTDCADTLIGKTQADGISMENRKKLSIATELLTNPPILFHDEPTAGVDPIMAAGVVQVLKDLATMGHTVVCTFEKASSQLFDLFDSIMVLGEGRCVYFGARHEAVQFFTSLGYPCPPYHCPADYFLQILATSPDVTRRKRIDELCNTFVKSPYGARAYEQRQDETFKARVRRSSSVKERVQDKTKTYTADWCTQLTTLLWRHFIMMRRRLRIAQMQFLHIVVISLLLGAAYFKLAYDQFDVHNIVALLFLLILFLSGDTLWATMKQMRYELPLVMKERRRGLYGIDTYLISKFFAEIPGSVVYPILSSAIVYWMAGLTPEGLRFVVFTCIIVLVANAGASCGLFLSLLTKSQTLTLSVVVVFVLPLLTLGGFLFNTRTTPVFLEWLQYLSWYKYAFEALVVNQWQDMESIEHCNSTSKVLCTREQIFQQYGLDKDNMVIDFMALIGLCIGFQLLSLMVLLLKTSSRWGKLRNSFTKQMP